MWVLYPLLIRCYIQFFSFLSINFSEKVRPLIIWKIRIAHIILLGGGRFLCFWRWESEKVSSIGRVIWKGRECDVHTSMLSLEGHQEDILTNFSFSCIQSGQNVFCVFWNFKLDTSTRFDSLRLKRFSEVSCFVSDSLIAL